MTLGGAAGGFDEVPASETEFAAGFVDFVLAALSAIGGRDQVRSHNKYSSFC